MTRRIIHVFLPLGLGLLGCAGGAGTEPGGPATGGAPGVGGHVGAGSSLGTGGSRAAGGNAGVSAPNGTPGDGGATNDAGRGAGPSGGASGSRSGGAATPADGHEGADGGTNLPYRVGASKVDITGPFVGSSTGYNEPGSQMSGLGMRLYSRAFVIEDPNVPGSVVAVATADVLHAYLSLKLGVVKKLAADGYRALRDDNVMVAGTHTHSAPSNVSWYSTYDNVNGVAGFDPVNYAVIVGGIARSIEQAYDSRKPGAVRLVRGELPGAATNRAPKAYAADPDAKDYATNVDETMTLLRFEHDDGTAIGALNFYGVHGTSLSIDNRREHGDNKGYAAYAFEHAKGGGFVAAFAQAAFGDVSPNSPDPSDPDKPFQRPSDVDSSLDPLEDPIRAGAPQRDRAMSLHESKASALPVGLATRYAYRDYDRLAVDGAYVGTHVMSWDTGPLQYPFGTPVAAPDPQVRTTCPGVVGGAILSGDPEGAPISISPEGSIHNTYSLDSGTWVFHKFDLTTLGPVLTVLGVAVNVLANTNQYDACHREKYALIGVGDGDPPSVPTILPLQLLQIGSLAIAAAPFELTTMTARRIEKQLLGTLAPHGIDTVVVAGMANGYAQYMATREEYSTQYFEGSSTLFGPWASAATVQELDRLAQDLVANRTPAPGPLPPDLSGSQTALTPIATSGVPLDGAGAGFGAVLTDAKSEYAGAHDTVTVSFQGAHPRTIQELQVSGGLKPYYDPDAYRYFVIEKQSGGAWQPAHEDGDPYTAFDWADSSTLGNGASTVTVTWLLRNADPGTYRIVYSGLAKVGASSYMPFHGASSSFVVR